MDSPRTGNKRVLDRWQPAVDSQKSPLATSFKATSTSNMDNGASRKAGTVTLLASKFATSKESLSDNHVTSPTTLKHSGSFKDVSSIRRHWSESVDSTEKPEPTPTSLRRQKSMGAKVSERWHFQKQDNTSPLNKSQEPSFPSKTNREAFSSARTQSLTSSSTENLHFSPSRSRPLSTSSTDSQKVGQLVFIIYQYVLEICLHQSQYKYLWKQFIESSSYLISRCLANGKLHEICRFDFDFICLHVLISKKIIIFVFHFHLHFCLKLHVVFLIHNN